MKKHEGIHTVRYTVHAIRYVSTYVYSVETSHAGLNRIIRVLPYNTPRVHASKNRTVCVYRMTYGSKI